MRSCDVLIVGGGPAGSTAAWQLRRAGADVLVLDRERFPRLKLCAGWITPEVVRDLSMDLGSYPHRLLTFPRLRVHMGRWHLPVPCVQHSIRRFEFDAWLLERSGAEVVQHNVRHIKADAEGYLIDDAFRCRYLIGAGGTRCPVYRELFRELNPRESALQIVTLEHEIPYDWADGDCHLWFFEQGLPGYSWYVPKERGWLPTGATSSQPSSSGSPRERSTIRAVSATTCAAMWRSCGATTLSSRGTPRASPRVTSARA
jgi:flavin-dependent dehydrogenase